MTDAPISRCPFCGSTEVTLDISHMLGGLTFECDNCAMVILPPEETRAEAIIAWNRRQDKELPK
jgi:Lar family restriction alleviation protein